MSDIQIFDLNENTDDDMTIRQTSNEEAKAVKGGPHYGYGDGIGLFSFSSLSNYRG